MYFVSLLCTLVNVVYNTNACALNGDVNGLEKNISECKYKTVQKYDLNEMNSHQL